MVAEIRCCFCGKIQKIEMTPEQYDMYVDRVPMDKVLPDAHPMVREALISQICFDCQSRLFNVPKPWEDWGKELKSCVCCNTRLWSKDIKDGKIECSNCGEIREEAL